MPYDLTTAMLYAVLPPLAGVAFAIAQILRARSELVEPLPPEAARTLPILMAIPVTAPIFGLLAAFQASTREAGSDLTVPLIVLGVVGFLVAAAQGVIAARRVPTLAQGQQAFGRTIMMMSLAEPFVILALLWVMMTLGATSTTP